MREYQKQLDRKQQEVEEQNANDHQKKINRFLEKEATYSVNQSVKTLLSSKSEDQSISSILATPSTTSKSSASTRISTNDDLNDDIPPSVISTPSSTLSNMDGTQAKQLPSFWVPSLTPYAKKTELKKPDQHVYCPVSGKPISMKDLIDVKFKLANDVDPKKRPLVAVRDRYVCAVTGDLLGNSVPCAVLRTSGAVVTMDCVNKLIKLDMIDPLTGAKLTDDDIIPMQRGGTGKKCFVYMKTLSKNFFLFLTRIFGIWRKIRREITNTCYAVVFFYCSYVIFVSYFWFSINMSSENKLSSLE